jgi:uncharacterized iron-regulated protein
MAQKAAYQLFDAKGKKISYAKWLKKAAETDVICFGELHNNPIAHWLQYELLSDLIQQRGAENLVVGAEMFEADQQAALSQYLNGEIDAKGLDEAIKLWPNYETDYKPVVDLCKKNKIAVIATNVPRKYARKVAMEGGLKALDSLDKVEKAWIAPLPFEIDFDLPGYAAMKEMMGGHGGSMKANDFIAAQAVKDATMAYFLLKHLGEDQLFYHLNGSYHSNNKEGILWYVNQARPELARFNISVVEQSKMGKLEDEHLGVADVIIVVPESMTKTY